MAMDGNFGSSQIIAPGVLRDFSCAPCSDDGKITDALFQCTDCRIFYCQRCVTGHNKFTKHHNVVERTSKLFGQGQRQPRSVSSGELPTDLCEVNTGQVIQMFCGEHDTVCCTICIAVNHRSCDGVEYIPTIVGGLLNTHDRDDTKSSLEKVKTALQNLETKMEAELKALNKQRDETLDGIQTIKNRLIDKLVALEKKSVEEVKEKHKQIANDINAWSKKVNDMMIDVELRLDKLKQSQADSDVQTFVDIKYGEKQASDGNDCIKQYLATKLETLEFSVNTNVETFLREVQSLGTLTVLAAEKAVDGALVTDFPGQNALPAQMKQYVYPETARPGSAYGQQMFARPGSAYGQQMFARPGSAYGQQMFARPGSAYGQQMFARPGSAYGQQLFARPGSAYGQQTYIKKGEFGFRPGAETTHGAGGDIFGARVTPVFGTTRSKQFGAKAKRNFKQ